MQHNDSLTKSFKHDVPNLDEEQKMPISAEGISSSLWEILKDIFFSPSGVYILQKNHFFSPPSLINHFFRRFSKVMNRRAERGQNFRGVFRYLSLFKIIIRRVERADKFLKGVLRYFSLFINNFSLLFYSFSLFFH